jgi:hypothetical protein
MNGIFRSVGWLLGGGRKLPIFCVLVPRVHSVYMGRGVGPDSLSFLGSACSFTFLILVGGVSTWSSGFGVGDV